MSDQNQPHSLLIRGGRLIDPASGLDSVCDVAVRGETISSIGPDLPADGFDEIIEAAGMIVCPGLIDPHVHLREPGGEAQETIESGTRAALAGGFTTVCSMPNTLPPPDTAARVEDLLGRIQATAMCRVFPVAAASVHRRGDHLNDIASLVKAGAVGISDDGDALWPDELMEAALKACRSADVAFMQHCQDPTMTVGSTMNEGSVSMRLGLTGWPDTAESSVIERDASMAIAVGARYHAQHVSAAKSVPVLAAARAQSENITAEASPHHLNLTEASCDGYNTSAKVNPPLRTEADMLAIRDAVAQGVITVLATDHAPHTADAKLLPFDQAPFGLIGLESALPLYARALVHTGLIEWPRLVELMTINPARLCNLDRLGLGSLKTGGPADITVIDPDLEWRFTAEQCAGRNTNSPFLGWDLKGKAVAVVINGRVSAAHSGLCPAH